MSHENGLSEACKQADQLNALLVAMTLASDELDTTDLQTLVTLAFDLAGGPACWLLEEQHRREKKNAQTS
ncbi:MULTISPECIES: hypothetical protein [Serratia]|uniref:hypothetical protein n=1 Tax=Serratia TaxID=613 RepID=UPI000EFCF077|nr:MULTISPECIES: hypothetical protein [Serratia]AYO37201.1 hypothetical protein EBA31_07765 [Serratia sp. P2ACOL2]CAI1043087.1 Uncharacterised protein [Serratia liquefaciens]CAI1545896.1 Uncharacterised protein [Serratia liquefaciens]